MNGSLTNLVITNYEIAIQIELVYFNLVIV